MISAQELSFLVQGPIVPETKKNNTIYQRILSRIFNHIVYVGRHGYLFSSRD